MHDTQAQTTPSSTRSAIANGETTARLPYARTIELRGHIIDSHILSQVMDLVMDHNAEFYIELSRHLLDMTTEVHRAEACRQAVEDEAFKDHALRAEYKDATIINQRTGERAPLSLLVDATSDENIDKMRAIGLAIRGGADGKSGAAACMAELESTNLGGKFHNDIEACHWSREPLPGAHVIHEYCPPHIERPGAAP